MDDKPAFHVALNIRCLHERLDGKRCVDCGQRLNESKADELLTPDEEAALRIAVQRPYGLLGLKEIAAWKAARAYLALPAPAAE